MRVTACGQECLLGYYDVMVDVNIVLIVEPYTFADPGTVSNVQLPGKLDPGSWPEYYSLTNLCAKEAKNPYPQT